MGIFMRGDKNIHINGVLVLYHHHMAANAPTIMEHVHCFDRHSRFKVWEINTELGFPHCLQKLDFAVIILHYSLFGLPMWLNKRFKQFLDQSKNSYKIAFLQDEYRYWPQRSDFLNKYDVDCVYTLVTPEFFDVTYRKKTNVRKLIYCLPGYVSHEIEGLWRKYGIPDEQRGTDVGYRGRRLPYYLGRGSQEKHWIGVEFKKRAARAGLVVDIETDENARIYGEAWPRFLANCKAVLGVEAGVSVFDIDDKVRPRYAEMVTGHPDISFPDQPFEQVYENLLKPYEDKIFYRTISPRHFEAASLRVCQILFEGKYSGILKPMKHYIPLKKDFSNFDEVITMFRDAELRRQLTENAYNDLIASGKYTYKRFVEDFDRELAKEGFSPEITQEIIHTVNRLLARSRIQLYLHRKWMWLRWWQFPGRGIVKFMLRPALVKAGLIEEEK